MTVDIDSGTQLLGLLGHPLEHSFSPKIHNYACEKLGLNYAYLCFDILPEDLKEALAGLRALGVRGFNVTIPYKRDVMKAADRLHSPADEIGAVNTVVNENGIFHAYNTDAGGFLRMLKKEAGFSPAGSSALIAGAGGAARAVGISLLEAGVDSLRVVNRTPGKGKELVAEWREFYPGTDLDAGELRKEYYSPLLREVELVVDTTPVGMSPNTDVEPVLSPSVLHSNLLVVDLVYNPAETVLMKAARRAGATTLNGEGMLLYQALEAFQLWTGVDPFQLDWPENFFHRN
ncbi:MAG: shikimate dehydrogenase [Bacillota bacterium]